MGIAQSALILLGIGIISERFGAGVGLGELGTGIKTLAGAPLGGVGAGLFEFSAGLKALGDALGDIGRGFGDLFANIPQLPGYVGPGGAGSGQLPPPTGGVNGNGNGLITVSGGDPTTNLPGGGGNVPFNGWYNGGFTPTPTPPPPAPPDDPTIPSGAGGSTGGGGSGGGVYLFT